MRIRKAVITAAGGNQRALPLQTLIHNGAEKSVLSILIEQALTANIGEICVVVWPGDETRYAQAAGNLAGAVRFVPQQQPRGYGHAIYCAREFVADEPFLHMVGDHLYVSTTKPGVQRLVELAELESCSASGVQPTHERLLSRFGAVAGRRMSGRAGVYRVETVLEKPTPTEAEQRLMVPGIRAGHYLCFFGIHVFTPTVMELLGRRLASEPSGTLTLSAALAELARQEQYLALEDTGRRYDLGARYGLLTAQLALALNGRDRDEVLTHLLELLAERELTTPSAGDER
ncbi:MAG: sugar phosphate nucleotidyltransferase [Candidatus Acidiferrales bacterium]